jgi:hypothetical protein
MRIAPYVLLTTIAFVPAHRATAAVADSRPEVRSPQQNQHIGEAGDPQCERDRPCFKIRAEGWVPSGRSPFFVVAPVKAAPAMWVQTPVRGVTAGGIFSGLIQLGEAHNGATQYFKIYALACASPDRFAGGEELVAFPDDCAISDPVEVYRER